MQEVDLAALRPQIMQSVNHLSTDRLLNDFRHGLVNIWCRSDVETWAATVILRACGVPYGISDMAEQLDNDNLSWEGSSGYTYSASDFPHICCGAGGFNYYRGGNDGDPPHPFRECESAKVYTLQELFDEYAVRDEEDIDVDDGIDMSSIV